MADKDLGDGDGPSLEMPSLGNLFKRKKKQAPEQDDSLTPTAEELNAVVRGERPSRTAEEHEPTASGEGEPDATPAEVDDVPTEVVAPVSPTDDEPDTDPTPELQADDEPTTVVPVLDDETDAEQTAVLTGVGSTEVPEAEQVETVPDESAASTTHSTTEDDAAPLFVDEVDDETATDLEDPDEDEDDGDDEETDPSEPRPERQFALPPLPGRVAAVITGLVIGVLAVAMTYLSVLGCEKVKGTSTCGTPGFFLLIAIMILLVVLGSALLGAWKVSDPGSTSFLAVGLLAVIALLFLVRVIFSPWMIVVIPVVAVVTFAASHWLTSLFVDEDIEDTEDAHA